MRPTHGSADPFLLFLLLLLLLLLLPLLLLPSLQHLVAMAKDAAGKSDSGKTTVNSDFSLYLYFVCIQESTEFEIPIPTI